MEILTFSKAAEVLGVTSATISRWVKDEKLKEGPKAGKQKTVTKESMDTLAANPAFQIGRESGQSNNKKRIIAQIYAKQEELEEAKQRIDKLEKLVERVSEEVKELRNYTQNNGIKPDKLRKIAQNNDENGRANTILQSQRRKGKKKKERPSTK